VTAAATIARRRGACPGLSSPMPTGDGLLVRLQTVGTIPLGAFTALCREAERHGNGIIEITARGNIQVRGLSTASAPRFADAVAALNVAAADGTPILSNVLAGIDPEEILDAAALAADLRRALAQTSLSAGLGAKVSVVIDGGGVLGLDALAADIRTRAELIDGVVMLRVGVGGDGASAADLGVIMPADAAQALLRLLEVIGQRGREARARDIVATEGVAPFGAAIADLLRTSGRPKNNSRLRGTKGDDPIGLHPLSDERFACGIGLAFGHADAATLRRLIVAAAAADAVGLRTAPGRALMIIGLNGQTCSRFIADAESLGFVVRADDPRQRVVACAGAPICASAFIAARAVAPLVAETAAPLFGGAHTIHISGCAKGCAHSARAALTAVGTPDGCALIANGTTHDAPFATVAATELTSAVAQYARQTKREGSHA
jgi:precorrin-3B synthase